ARRTRHAPWQGEPKLGVCPNPRRTAKARDPGLGQFDPESAAPTWSRTWTAERTHLVGIPACPSPQRARHVQMWCALLPEAPREADFGPSHLRATWTFSGRCREGSWGSLVSF